MSVRRKSLADRYVFVEPVLEDFSVERRVVVGGDLVGRRARGRRGEVERRVEERRMGERGRMGLRGIMGLWVGLS